MSRTLNLVDALLMMGRRHQELGRVHDALAVLVRLAGFRELPREVAEETQVRLAELQMRRRKYQRARRHLAVALRYDPANARYHYLMASVLRQQDEEHWDKAAEHYRRSLELDPQQPACLAEFGLFAVRLGHADEGLKCLRQALAIKGDEPELLSKLAEALRLAGRADEARGELRAALFRNPRDRRFRQLWADFQFRQLRRQQQARQADRRDAEGPVLLPFVTAPRPAGAGGHGKILRHDSHAPLQPPHGNRHARRSDQSHVQ
jgi:tetratricopeptide (TPR) repeat protein